ALSTRSMDVRPINPVAGRPPYQPGRPTSAPSTRSPDVRPINPVARRPPSQPGRWTSALSTRSPDVRPINPVAQRLPHQPAGSRKGGRPWTTGEGRPERYERADVPPGGTVER